MAAIGRTFALSLLPKLPMRRCSHFCWQHVGSH